MRSLRARWADRWRGDAGLGNMLGASSLAATAALVAVTVGGGIPAPASDLNQKVLCGVGSWAGFMGGCAMAGADPEAVAQLPGGPEPMQISPNRYLPSRLAQAVFCSPTRAGLCVGFGYSVNGGTGQWYVLGRFYGRNVPARSVNLEGSMSNRSILGRNAPTLTTGWTGGVSNPGSPFSTSITIPGTNITIPAKLTGFGTGAGVFAAGDFTVGYKTLPSASGSVAGQALGYGLNVFNNTNGPWPVQWDNPNYPGGVAGSPEGDPFPSDTLKKGDRRIPGLADSVALINAFRLGVGTPLDTSKITSELPAGFESTYTIPIDGARVPALVRNSLRHLVEERNADGSMRVSPTDLAAALKGQNAAQRGALLEQVYGAFDQARSGAGSYYEHEVSAQLRRQAEGIDLRRWYEKLPDALLDALKRSIVVGPPGRGTPGPIPVPR